MVLVARIAWHLYRIWRLVGLIYVNTFITINFNSKCTCSESLSTRLEVLCVTPIGKDISVGRAEIHFLAVLFDAGKETQLNGVTKETIVDGWFEWVTNEPDMEYARRKQVLIFLCWNVSISAGSGRWVIERRTTWRFVAEWGHRLSSVAV